MFFVLWNKKQFIHASNLYSGPELSTSVMSSLKIAKGFQWTELTLYSLKRG